MSVTECSEFLPRDDQRFKKTCRRCGRPKDLHQWIGSVDDVIPEVPVPLVEQAREMNTEVFNPLIIDQANRAGEILDLRGDDIVDQMSGLPEVNPKELAAAARPDKPPLSLLEHKANVDIAWAMAEGARKYGRKNYRTIGTIKATVYIDAMERHIGEWKDGQDIDPDSGLSPLAKIAASIHVLYGAIDAGTFEDDR